MTILLVSCFKDTLYFACDSRATNRSNTNNEEIVSYIEGYPKYWLFKNKNIMVARAGTDFSWQLNINVQNTIQQGNISLNNIIQTIKKHYSSGYEQFIKRGGEGTLCFLIGGVDDKGRGYVCELKSPSFEPRWIRKKFLSQGFVYAQGAYHATHKNNLIRRYKELKKVKGRQIYYDRLVCESIEEMHSSGDTTVDFPVVLAKLTKDNSYLASYDSPPLGKNEFLQTYIPNFWRRNLFGFPLNNKKDD